MYCNYFLKMPLSTFIALILMNDLYLPIYLLNLRPQLIHDLI